MYHYLFTNDLRISTLSESLKRAGHCFMTDSVPSANENKNDNNNMKTLGFYFNLTENSNCAVACSNGDVRKVVLNFIKKFQFPNPRTSESLSDSINDNILIAPMRVVLQVLYNMQMLYPEAAYLTREEIKDFIFYNLNVAKNRRFNVIELIEQIINYRQTSVYPDSVERSLDKRHWKQEDRQIREMTKILTWSGCVSEDENQRLFIQHDNLTVENKSDLFDILTYNKFWKPQSTKTYAENRQDYENYMDFEYDSRKNIDFADDDIFSGFALWLTSYNNPDYTGSQKYTGYPRNLERLVEFMENEGLINDANLNDKNLEKFNQIKEIYYTSEEAIEFDTRYLASNGGIAALKKYIKYIEFLLSANSNSNMKTNCMSFDYSITQGRGINKIFYGVPGCGKSYHIQHEILEKNSFAESNIVRTTFYQDYSNTDFVGQILPKITKDEDGKDIVEYIFNPGPFTIALTKAISNPNDKIALVVEEINRGNAPTIFGDIFQLLDRDKNSISEYGIVNVGIKDYLEKFNFGTETEPVYYTFESIKIPGNLYIYATMNTSDQNVYTLDTAFTRRWSKERIPNDFKNDEIQKLNVPGMKEYTWKEFVDSINSQIQNKLDDLQVNEDKQLGAFFVKKSDLINENDSDETIKEKTRLFAYKVLEYLWDDVSKLDHAVIFNPSHRTFEGLVNAYISTGVSVFNSGIFAPKTTDNELSN